jgi:ribosomal protein S18 acetylase RimI-like enzyme
MIRAAGINDIQAILHLEEKLFDNAMSEKMMHHELTRGRGWVYGNPIEGYILLRFDSGLTDITRIGVAPDSQKKGIGKALLEHALQGRPDALLTVKKDNETAIKLYRRFGFQVVAHLAAGGALVLRRRAASPLPSESA